MYIIESITEQKSWISVILRDKEEALEHLAKLSSNNNGVTHNLVYAPIVTYPFTVIESLEIRPPQFAYLSVESTKDYLINLPFIKEEDHQYCILFTIYEDYISPKYGEDYMGILHHEHVDNEFLIHYKNNPSNL